MGEVGQQDRDNPHRLTSIVSIFARWERRKPLVLYVAAATTLLLAAALGCISGNERTQMRVINAGSLMVPFSELEAAFEELHPDVDVLIEGHGSIQVIRQVTELGAAADLIAVADHSLIPMMMYGVQMPDGNSTYADWCLRFATNRLGLAYTQDSRCSGEIDTSNWFEVLARPDVRAGMSDPRFDSCGYRALMASQLAEIHYEDHTLFEGVIGAFSPPIEVTEDEGCYCIAIPQVLRPERITLRGSSVALLATVQSGDIDYAFMYQSVAEQHGLLFLPFPEQIDLFSDSFRQLAPELKVKLSYQRFASVTPEFLCQPIVYGLTIPTNAPEAGLAVEFISFLLGPEGQEVFAANHQDALIPIRVDHPELLPAELREYLED